VRAMPDDDVIAQATSLLSTLMHCRRQAQDLQRCQRDQPSRGCIREQSAFVTCSNEHISLVIGHLVKIADVHCVDFIREFQRCKSFSPGSDCMHEDLAVMRCAARKVLESAQATVT